MATTSFEPDLISRYAAPVPRYTSYPTAPHFHDGVNAETYAAWLSALPAGSRLGLYAHMPFCDTLCWFCGCNTKITQQYKPIETYLAALTTEIEMVALALPRDHAVDHIHWGGGSPTILSAADSRRLMDALRKSFNFSSNAEFAVEVDPRGLDQGRIDALAESGLTRVSIGVQDFDPKVQAAINRIQSVEETRRVIDAFRRHNVKSLNIDAIYGLPKQGEAELTQTLSEVVKFKPDRIALFGYAHVPWMKRHQSMINETDLANSVERHAHAELAASLLINEGYVRIGIDHFALPHDSLALAAAQQQVQRNFQGYTVDKVDALIGLGASSIGKLPQGFIQNVTAIGDYQRRITAGNLAVAKGVALSRDDEIRSYVIERLMCDLALNFAAISAQFGEDARSVLAQAALVAQANWDGLLESTPSGFRITNKGRPFTRTIAAQFDAYLPTGKAKHSLAV